jgi:MFS family permease
MPQTPADTLTAETLAPEELARIQRRTLRVLMLSQTLGSAGVSIAVTEGGPIMRELTGGSRWAGSASACATVGGAIAGLLLSGLMRRRGRRPGLMRGYAIAVGGAAIVVLGAQNRWTPVFIVGMLFFGVGQGTNLLSRYAAADLALPNERGRAISLLLFGSTFGAVFAQVLVPWCEDIADNVGMWKLTGPFVFAGMLLAIAAINSAVRLKPDPLVLAGGVVPEGPKGFRLPAVGHALRVIGASRNAKLGLASMSLAQAAMVAIMTMTPIHMLEHHNTEGLRGYVIALHVCGMYLFAPVVGRLVDLRGRLQVIIWGSAILILATLVSAGAGHQPSLLFLGLFLLGIGWSGAMIGGTTLLNESVPNDERVHVQGSADLLMSLGGGAAGFSSGFIKQAVEYHWLSILGTMLGLALLLAALSTLRASNSAATDIPAAA